jgi:hypothetical protein
MPGHKIDQLILDLKHLVNAAFTLSIVADDPQWGAL